MSRFISARRALLALLLSTLAVAQLAPASGLGARVQASNGSPRTTTGTGTARVPAQTFAVGASGSIKIERVAASAPAATNGAHPNVDSAPGVTPAFYVKGSRLTTLQGVVNIYAHPHAPMARPIISSIYLALLGSFKVGPYTTLPAGQYDLSVTDSKGITVLAPKVFQVSNPRAAAAIVPAAPHQSASGVHPASGNTCPPGTPDALGPAQLYNAFFRKNFALRNSDSEGAVAAGGDVTLQSFAVGALFPPGVGNPDQGVVSTPGLSTTNGITDVLIAGGAISATDGNFYGGNAIYGTTLITSGQIGFRDAPRRRLLFESLGSSTSMPPSRN